MTPGALTAINGPRLLGISFGGFAYTIVRALGSGAGAYSDSMSEETSRQFEDLFLFIPARRIAEIGWAACRRLPPLFRPALRPAQPGLHRRPRAGADLRHARADGPHQARRGSADEAPPEVQLPARRGPGQHEQRPARRLQHQPGLRDRGAERRGEAHLAGVRRDAPADARGHEFLRRAQSLDKRVGSDDLTLVVTSIDIARRTGGNLTEIFDKIGLTIRERMRIERRVMTLTSQGRLQGIIVACMPAVLGALMTFIKPGLMIPFFKSVNGMVSVGITVLLIAVGWFFISKIIKIDV